MNLPFPCFLECGRARVLCLTATIVIGTTSQILLYSTWGNTEIVELARNTYGAMPTVSFLINLNDSLALSQIVKMPVTLDEPFTPLLKYATQGHQSLVYPVFDRLAECHLPTRARIASRQSFRVFSKTDTHNECKTTIRE